MPKAKAIYGAEWAGTSDPSWVRTDAAVGFANPNPYYSGMSTTPSSPFDNIMPWAGMQKIYNEEAGWLVEIPKFYYKWTRDGVKMKLQISMSQFDGSYVSPAHADRGDGVGERDYVYVGRYHCASDYKSKTGVTPQASATRATFRSSIHNLGSNIWQYDFAMRWTIGMLYLVEYANWDSQGKIGFGCGSSDSAVATGTSDTMLYHTGTMQSTRTTYGVGVQYRNIEDLWANVLDWTDGIYFNGTSTYCIKNPANFSDSTGGTLVGYRSNTDWNYIVSMTNPTAEGFEYALVPASITTSQDIYITDAEFGKGTVLKMGAYWSRTKQAGMFSYFADSQASETHPAIGSRLMILPSSRLSA